MDRNFLRYVGVLLMIATTGCAMCDNSQDRTFGAYGGRWQRTDPHCGRVASVIDPAGANVAGPQSLELPEQGEDDGRESVLKPEVTDQSDEGHANELPAEAMPIDQPAPAITDNEPAADKTKPDSDSTIDDAAPTTRTPVELPDFFKELGLDSDPSPSAGNIEDLLPSDDLGNELPPLRTDADQ